MVVAALLLLLVVWLVSRDTPPGPGADPGEAAAQEFIRAYVAALNTNDPDTLAAFLGEPSGSREIEERLAKYGGLALQDVRVVLVNEFPRIYRVQVDARAGDGRIVEMTEVLEWTRTRWHLAPLAPPG